jgi:hypothetical protein
MVAPQVRRMKVIMMTREIVSEMNLTPTRKTKTPLKTILSAPRKKTVTSANDS